jgi:hypothetical protein
MFNITVDAFSGRTHGALDRAVVEYLLVEVPSTGRSNRPGGRSNRLGQERRRKPKIAAPGGTPSGTTRLGLF